MRARGFTLMEVVITLAILLVVIGALFGVVQGQQTAFYQGNLQRASQTSARTAAAYVAERLVTAGYAMDPVHVFDLNGYTSDLDPCPLTDCVLDATDENDELVFLTRNPRYWLPEVTTTNPVGNAWWIVSVVGNVLTIQGKEGDSFDEGRILQAVCPGAEAYAYFTVETATSVATTGKKDIPLLAVDATNPFRRQDLASACFQTGQARLFLIDRYRFHVRPVTVDGNVVPYLVLDRGFGTGEVVVAEGIETFQVAYEMASSALSPRGADPGTAITFKAGFPGETTGSAMTILDFTDYGAPSWFVYPLAGASARATDHQANIRAVRLAIRARAATPHPTGGAPGILVPVLNMDTLPDWIDPSVNYDRAIVELTVPVRNMLSRGLQDH